MSHEPDRHEFYAVCRDCGSVTDASRDNQFCACGGVYHVDSARCLACGGRHPFTAVGDRCSCGGEIVPKMATCPTCGKHLTADHLGEHCASCSILLRMEG
ncbi:MAG: hypothetical protein P1P84_25260 [Deferrisomatales bacterium]|nr:hypothetical protein [Deferrisomatales bacterium]